MFVLALSLLACSGSPEAPPAPVDPPPPAPVEPPAPAPLPPAGAGETRLLDLDNPGGANGAPQGAMFVVPGGADASATSGPLSDGATGAVLEVRTAADALVCAQAVRMSGKTTFTGRTKLTALTKGAGPYDGLNVELRARGEANELIPAATTRYTLLHNFTSVGGWEEWSYEAAPPAGAVKGELCLRFVGSAGRVEIDALGVTAAGVAPAGVAAADVQTTPIAETRWDLDAPGGVNGAPLGFEFIVPTPDATATAGDVGGATGFRLAATKPGNALACSDRFALVGPGTAKVRIKVDKVDSDARGWTGFVTELRAWDAAGALVSPAGAQYTTLDTAKAAGDWREVTAPFTPPAGAATGRICVRFVEATGVAAVDWVAVGG